MGVRENKFYHIMKLLENISRDFLNNKVVFLQVCGCQFDKDPSPERKITLLETVMAIQRNEKDGE